mmetsp:Transcript_30841/g.51172  ORF Transcript_30841/g.51172 Transcript_30841/m.51172 type:complete len:262 (-) Transcript_30841:215-1000(-)
MIASEKNPLLWLTWGRVQHAGAPPGVSREPHQLVVAAAAAVAVVVAVVVQRPGPVALQEALEHARVHGVDAAQVQPVDDPGHVWEARLPPGVLGEVVPVRAEEEGRPLSARGRRHRRAQRPRVPGGVHHDVAAVLPEHQVGRGAEGVARRVPEVVHPGQPLRVHRHGKAHGGGGGGAGGRLGRGGADGAHGAGGHGPQGRGQAAVLFCWLLHNCAFYPDSSKCIWRHPPAHITVYAAFVNKEVTLLIFWSSFFVFELHRNG